MKNDRALYYDDKSSQFYQFLKEVFLCEYFRLTGKIESMYLIYFKKKYLSVGPYYDNALKCQEILVHYEN